MTILLLSEVFPPKIGGSGRWMWELHRRLTSHETHVVAALDGRAAAFDAASPMPIHRIPLRFYDWGPSDPRAGFQYVAAFLRLGRLVSRIRPDVIHCARSLPEGLLAYLVHRRHRIPFTCFAHGEELTLADTSQELRWLTKRVMGAARSVVANTHHTKGIVVNRFAAAADRVIVMHPGVDATEFTPAPPDPQVRQRFGWGDRRVVLTVGTLLKRKGQDMMIRALPEIRRHCPDVLYVIVGDGPDRQYLQAVVDECRVGDHVQFRRIPNDDAELVRCYQQCDLFALPNRQVDWDIEGFGIVLIEAQACGKPVLAGRSGGTPETLEPGKTGELVACETPEAVAAAVTGLLTDPSRRAGLGQRARQHVLDRFDWPVLARQAEALWSGPQPAGKNPRSED